MHRQMADSNHDLQRPTSRLSVLLLAPVVAIATLILGSCGGDDSSSGDGDSTTTVDGTESPAGDSDNTGDDAPAPSGGTPTGRLTLDGETWELTLDKGSPTAMCQVLDGNSAIVTGMRTPEGNRVDFSVQEEPSSSAYATYYGTDGTPLRSASDEESSESPEWSIDGSTVRVSGKWALRTDPSQPEVDGELEVTC